MEGLHVFLFLLAVTCLAESKYVYPGYKIPHNYHYMNKHNYPEPGPDIPLKYCETRQPQQCCPGRDDSCTVPILDRVCYCDLFCNRTQADCCPDFSDICIWPPPKTEEVTNNCRHNSVHYNPGDTVVVNCNNCTCVNELTETDYEWKCTRTTCLIRDDIINHVASEDFGWTATNYSFLWSMSLTEGIRYRLGTFRPQASVVHMTSLNVHPNEYMPEEFNSLEEWPSYIHPVYDQGNCGSSWAVSTASVAADRLSIHSNGILNDMLSPQHLISCSIDSLQQGCNGGHLDRAWWYLRRVGTVSDACYPYKSGGTDTAGRCLVPQRYLPSSGVMCPSGNGIRSKVFKATPPYRIANNEREIMKEIMDNGPVQATMEVKEDFYMYKSGVYSHSMAAHDASVATGRSGFHSVRIVGWGVDNSGPVPRKYWLCANSWGTQWGENGFFRIARGKNECRIESFVLGVWGKVNGRQITRRARTNKRRGFQNRPRSESRRRHNAI